MNIVRYSFDGKVVETSPAQINNLAPLKFATARMESLNN
jgi:hypothetical protein